MSTAPLPRATPPVKTSLRPGSASLRLVSATVRVYFLRFASNPIMLIRAPFQPLLILLGFHLAYAVSDQTRVAGVDAMGFLVVGMLATLAWSSTVWGAGNALQAEVYQGTISAVVAAPGRISSVILGYGLGSMVVNLPALAVSILTGLLLGADVRIDHPAAAVVALMALYACCLCIGLGFGGLFILSRQSNALSNFLQGPVYLLGGFFVPRSALPEGLQRVSVLLPIAHATDAVRATLLSGAGLGQIAGELLATALTSVVFLVAGLWGLHRLDEVVRRRGTLDLL
ncbi:MAG: ABC transporter permease [Nocardioidaceae bacterium]